MTVRILFTLFLLLSFISCEIEPKTPSVKPTPFDKTAYAKELTQTNQEKEVEQPEKIIKDSILIQPKVFTKTDTIPAQFIYGKIKIDTAKAIGQQFVFVLNTDTAKKIDLELTTQDTLSNLIITQIIDPKGNSEGPFGQNFLYEIKEKGDHKIIVSEDSTNPKPWAGKLTFNAKLKW